MSVPAKIDHTPCSLLQLVDHAAAALANARTAAEVLEAKDVASFAYDAAKRAARLANAKHAHDELIAAAHRALGAWPRRQGSGAAAGLVAAGKVIPRRAAIDDRACALFKPAEIPRAQPGDPRIGIG